MYPVVMPLNSDQATLSSAGGKGANLAELIRAGFDVPAGFVVTTGAYREFVQSNDIKTTIDATEVHEVETLSSTIRTRFESGTMPAHIRKALGITYHQLGSPPVAVRSSATAEDLPETSFAGQQDTYLNIIGEDNLAQAVMKCWGSLWTARAITYRERNDISHDDVSLAVIVQIMAPDTASGVMFTANPLTGKRAEVVIDATIGLGEALVSGQVEPDHYVVDTAQNLILSRAHGKKTVAIRALPDGGVSHEAIMGEATQTLTDEAILELAELGTRIAAHYDFPQDIEWAWSEGRFYVLQSRPITTLFPLPEDRDSSQLEVFISFAHVQGVMGPITPIGQEMMRLAATSGARYFGQDLTLQSQRILLTAGERMFIRITGLVRSKLARRIMGQFLRIAEPAAIQILTAHWDRHELTPSGRLSLSTVRRLIGFFAPMWGRIFKMWLRPEAERQYIIDSAEKQIRAIEAQCNSANTLSERLEAVQAAPQMIISTLLRRLMSTVASGTFLMAILAKMASNTKGYPHHPAEMTRGMPHNVTTMMDLALWETARTIQSDTASHNQLSANDPEVMAKQYIAGELPQVASEAISGFLARYGMRGVAEIDLGRQRWRDNPTPILQTIQSYLKIENPEHAPDAVFLRGQAAGEKAIAALIDAVGKTRGGWLKSRFVRWAAYRMHALAGLRETPKFYFVRMMGILRETLQKAGAELVDQGVIDEADDVFYLKFGELEAIARGNSQGWRDVVSERKATFVREMRRRQIPRLMFSDGMTFYDGMDTRSFDEQGHILGSPVSPGIVEGAVRVVYDPHSAQLAPGEILVCPGTDPAWTPLFLAAGGLVMEVGGMMTHGSVVAREYGIPAVVGVHQATSQLKTGQRIRVDGSSGHITVLDE